jgi:hypothetical protein
MSGKAWFWALVLSVIAWVIITLVIFGIILLISGCC